MSEVLVTGCAGFIGSHLAQASLERGDFVRGVDSFTDYYGIDQKKANLDVLLGYDNFRFAQADLSRGVEQLVDGVETIFHQAGQPGVRASWREEFDLYLARNVLSTQLLLEAAVRCDVRRFVYASSSSIYGNADRYPVDESMRLQPFSPYGVTKMAGEHLCSLYASNFGLATVSLRYFTVYGPRQRPDMAIHRLFEAALHGTEFPLFGSGEQLRDFTFVGDVVRANLLAADVDVKPGLFANVAGGSECTMLELIELVEQTTGRPVRVDRQDSERGDVRRTGGSIAVAHQALGWEPRVDLATGLALQHEWHRSR